MFSSQAEQLKQHYMAKVNSEVSEAHQNLQPVLQHIKELKRKVNAQLSFSFVFFLVAFYVCSLILILILYIDTILMIVCFSLGEPSFSLVAGCHSAGHSILYG